MGAPLLSAARLPPLRKARSFAPPPRGGFAFVVAPERQLLRTIVLPQSYQHIPHMGNLCELVLLRRRASQNPSGRSSGESPPTRLVDRLALESLPLHGYVSNKVQTISGCASALGSSRVTRPNRTNEGLGTD
jgi:hypothetical protein